jgi:hypothetical protein
MNLEEVEARWRAGHILASELPGVAQELVAAGHEVPALRQLIATPEPEAPAESRRTFERALRELGRGGMSGSEAAMVLARQWARELVDRKLPPRRVTSAIAHVRFRGSADVDEALQPFCDLEDAYDELSGSRLARVRRLALDRRARREARRLLACYPADQRV